MPESIQAPPRSAVLHRNIAPASKGRVRRTLPWENYARRPVRFARRVHPVVGIIESRQRVEKLLRERGLWVQAQRPVARLQEGNFIAAISLTDAFQVDRLGCQRRMGHPAQVAQRFRDLLAGWHRASPSNRWNVLRLTDRKASRVAILKSSILASWFLPARMRFSLRRKRISRFSARVRKSDARERRRSSARVGAARIYIFRIDPEIEPDSFASFSRRLQSLAAQRHGIGIIASLQLLEDGKRS